MALSPPPASKLSTPQARVLWETWDPFPSLATTQGPEEGAGSSPGVNVAHHMDLML